MCIFGRKISIKERETKRRNNFKSRIFFGKVQTEKFAEALGKKIESLHQKKFKKE